MLSEALRVGKNRGLNTFTDLYNRLKELYDERRADFRDAFELLSVTQSLTYYPQLETTKQEDKYLNDTIQMDRVLEDREVVYFWLPSALESSTVRTVAQLALFGLRNAAQDRQGKDFRQAYLFIDECQKLASENFQEILQQARSAGIAVILANQSVSDLKTPDCDLRATVQTNTRAKLFFSVSEPDDIRNLATFSGEEFHESTEQDSEVLRPRLSPQEILAVSDHPQQLFLHVTGGSGYTQFGGVPIPVQTDWPIWKSVTEEREKMPWPSSPMIVAVTPEEPPVALEPPKPPNRTKPTPGKSRKGQIQSMFDA